MDEQTKTLYKLGQGQKIISINFPDINVTYTTKDLERDQVNLTEALMDGNNIEFIGCKSNIFQSRIHGASADLEGQKVIVSMDIAGQNDPVVIFNGYVKNAKTRSDLAYKEIVAYDELVKKASDKDVASWYQGLTFPITIKNMRDSLFNHIGITQTDRTLPNDHISIPKIYNPQRFNALDVIKSICQFNGSCGIMNRENKFDYRFPAWRDDVNNPYPGDEEYPNTFYPAANDEIDLVVDNYFYHTMQYEEFVTAPITRVELRDDAKSPAYGYGSGTNKYIIQGNIFVRGLSDATKLQVARNIYDRVKNFQYRPCTYTAPALPWAEVGSVQTFWVKDNFTGGQLVKRIFPLLNRNIKGLQEFTDTNQTRGNKEQSEFVSSLNVHVDLINTDLDGYYTSDDIDSMLDTYMPVEGAEEMVTDITDTALSQMTQPTGLAFQSVYTAPSAPRANTLYGVLGGIIEIR